MTMKNYYIAQKEKEHNKRLCYLFMIT